MWETEEEDRDTLPGWKGERDESSEARVALRDDYNKLRRSFLGVDDSVYLFYSRRSAL